MADDVTGAVSTFSGDGALPIPSGRNGPGYPGRAVYYITKGSAAALTIGVPQVAIDDGKEVVVISATAQAHVLTQGTDGFNGKGASGTATWAANKGGVLWLIAMNGHWWTQQAIAGGVTIA